MATYIELLTAANDSTLRQKVAVACVVAAETIRTESVATPNHTTRLAWAKGVYNSPTQAADKMMWPVLAQNKAATSAAILGSSDATVQTAVDAAVDVFIV